jgi:hypothetical protein
MATSEQARLGQYGVDPYELGDCLRDTATNSSSKKLILRECPLCRMDPTRPRYPFADGEKRPDHFRDAHSADEI